MTQRHQRWLGAAFWISLLAAGAVWMLTGHRRTGESHAADTLHPSPASLILESLWSSTTSMELEDPTGVVRVGDVAFARRDSQWHEVGYITAVGHMENANNRLTLTLFDQDSFSPGAAFHVHQNSGRLIDVMTTLLPPGKRERLQQKLAAALENHAEAVAQEILPLVAESIQGSVPLIETALADAVERHEAEIDELVARYRDEIVRERIVPLVRDEVMPIVRQHGTEPAERIGREIWNQASVWRFGWRAIYDKSPLPERELVASEWDRFVEKEITPIVEAHLDDIAAAVEEIVKDLATNRKLRSELSAVVHTIAQDPEARELLRTIIREAIVDNQQLRQTWAEVWSSPEAKERLGRTSKRLEPILREISDEIMGTREQGIEAGFARVLRNQILSKDRTWITITPRQEQEREHEQNQDRDQRSDRGGETIVLRQAEKFMPYPLVYLAK